MDILSNLNIETYRKDHGELLSEMAHAGNLDKSVMEGLELRILEVVVVEAEKVVHDGVASQGGKGMGEIERLCTLLKLLHAISKRVNMAVDDVDKVENGTT